MSNLILPRVAAPGTYSPGKVATVCYLVIALVFVNDILSGSEVWFHGLYIFPLAALAIHTKQRGLIVLGFVLSTMLQAITFISYDISLSSKITDTSIAIVSSALILYFSTAVRDGYYETLLLSTRDPLTALLSRRAFESRLEAQIARQGRYGGVFSLVSIDLDNFKTLNDSYGHALGDEVLKLVSTVLRENIRAVDSLGRLDGDQFAILMPQTTEADCAARSQNLTIEIARRLASIGFPCTASIGFTTCDRRLGSASDVLARAERAMYAVKAAANLEPKAF